MNIQCVLTLAAMTLAGASAYGQGLSPQAPKNPQQQNPCLRSQSTISIGGVDQDVARCQEALTLQVVDDLGKRLAAQQAEQASLEAKLILKGQDAQLNAAKLGDFEKQLGYWQLYGKGADKQILDLQKQLQDLRAQGTPSAVRPATP